MHECKVSLQFGSFFFRLEQNIFLRTGNVFKALSDLLSVLIICRFFVHVLSIKQMSLVVVFVSNHQTNLDINDNPK